MRLPSVQLWRFKLLRHVNSPAAGGRAHPGWLQRILTSDPLFSSSGNRNLLPPLLCLQTCLSKKYLVSFFWQEKPTAMCLPLCHGFHDGYVELPYTGAVYHCIPCCLDGSRGRIYPSQGQKKYLLGQWGLFLDPVGLFSNLTTDSLCYFMHKSDNRQ